MTSKYVQISGELIKAYSIPGEQGLALAVDTPAYSVVATGEVAGGTVQAQLPDVTSRFALIRAAADNTGKVYIGAGTAVTKADGTTDTTTGYALAAGNEMVFLGANLNLLYRICDNAGDDLIYISYR